MKYLLAGEESERLLFKTVLASDFDAWLPFHQNPLSSKYWTGLPKDPVTACQQQFNGIFDRYINNRGGMNALICKNTAKLIGLCGILVQTIHGAKELEIGYSLLPAYWGNGYASEAAKKCKEVTFEKAWASHVISIIHVDNLPSKKVALKIGMSVRETTTYKENPVEIYQIKN